jgi:hypothetical protein
VIKVRWFVVKKGERVSYAGPYLLKLEAELLAQGLTRIHKVEFFAVELPVKFHRYVARMTSEGLHVRAEEGRVKNILRFYTLKGVYHFSAPSYLGAQAIAQNKFESMAHKSEETGF